MKDKYSKEDIERNVLNKLKIDIEKIKPITKIELTITLKAKIFTYIAIILNKDMHKM